MRNAAKIIENIQQKGVITNVDDRYITVAIDLNSNCAGCRAKAACGISESEAKEIQIPIDGSKALPNERVCVIMNKGLGMKAVFWGYICPFIVMILTLFIASVFLKEWQAGVLSLAILIPYYMILYLMRVRFSSIFKVSIKRDKA